MVLNGRRNASYYRPAVKSQSSLSHPAPGSVVLKETSEDGRTRWLRFTAPVETVAARTHAEVLPALRRVEQAAEARFHAAGFITYEAAPAFDPALSVKAPGALPLVWFGIYSRSAEWPHTPDIRPPEGPAPAWVPSVTGEAYRGAIGRTKELIARGDTYQVNYTWRLRAAFRGDPWALFGELYGAQEVPYAACVDLGNHVLCSVSPELLFSLDGDRIATRPMKGTAPRGLSWTDDEARRRELGLSPKNRAENIMIVDMMRNDLGRIARTGSVEVPRLFEVERYRTLFQMTSTVRALTDAPVSEIFRALFPSPSVTGAPKVRTMQIIAELEDSPRGIYTGAVGFLAPGRRAQFNVAIRTVHVDRAAGRAEFGTGGGITWDSVDREEYDECLTKGLVLAGSAPASDLLETLLWRPGRGYFLLDGHLERLSQSARYFGFPVDGRSVRERLETAALAFGPAPQRVRLLLGSCGEIRIESEPLAAGPRTWRVALARGPVDPASPFLYHKTTNRALYDRARADLPGHDDVILWNGRGEITESTIANVAARIRGDWITPPISCGLLPGVYRGHLIERGRLREGTIRLRDLEDAERLALVNSVRGWVPCRLDSQPGGG